MTDDRSTMRAEAVELGANAIDQLAVDYAAGRTDMAPDGVGCATVAFDAWFSPQSVPCSECHGTKEGPPEANPTDRGTEWVRQPCPECQGSGQVSSPPLALLMGELEQVGSAPQWDVEGDCDFVVVRDELEPDMHPVALYALRSGESSPNTGPST